MTSYRALVIDFPCYSALEIVLLLLCQEYL